MYTIGFTLAGRVFRRAYTAPALGGLQYAQFNPENGLFPVPTLLLETVVVSVKHRGNRCHLFREKRQTQFGVALLNHASQQTRCGNPTGRPVNCAAIASNLLLMTSRALMLGKQPGAQREVGADIQGRHLRPCRHQDQQQRTERNKFIHRCVQGSRMEWRSIVVRATVPRKRVDRGSTEGRQRVVKLHPCHFALMVLYRQPNGIPRARQNIPMVSVPPKGSALAPEKALEGACIYNEASTGFHLTQGA